jgi:hypothetical protein
LAGIAKRWFFHVLKDIKFFCAYNSVVEPDILPFMFVDASIDQTGVFVPFKFGMEEWGQSSLLTQSDALLAKKIGNMRP